MPANPPLSDDGYRALGRSVAWMDRSDRLRLEVTGPDRAKFLHNLTTNDVKRLAVAAGREAFVTSPQGKTLGYITYLATDRSLLVRTEPGQTSALMTHLRKYSVFDNVEIEEVTGRLLEYHLAGPRADDLVKSFWGILPQVLPYSHVTTTVQGNSVRIVRENPTGRPGLTILAPRELEQNVRELLARLGPPLGLAPLLPEEFDAARIEAGTPVAGRDVVPGNLPQEIDRDRLAIDFAKGCYLGQETVARLDALGHVNKKLTGLRLDGTEIPDAGTLLWAGDKQVGQVTSAAYSPGWRGIVALGVVRSIHLTPGTALVVGADGNTGRRAEVSALPMLPPIEAGVP